MRRLPGRAAVLITSVLLAGLLADGVAAPVRTPASAASLEPSPALTVDRARAVRLCGAGKQGPWGLATRWNDETLARQLLRGRIALRGGTFVLARNPTWKPQRGLDRSGNNGQHGLHWAMPLLREGIRRHDARLVDRFYAIVADWARDNPRRRPVTAAAWEDYQVGTRLLTLVCAAAGPRGREPWLRAVLAEHLRVVAAPGGWRPVNNASLLSSAGLLAAGCVARDRRAVAVAVGRFRTLGARLYKRDGSDGEGAPAYTYANYLAQADHDARMRVCGVVPPRSVRATAAMPRFLAAATRPDGMLEAIGDSGLTAVRPSDVVGTVAEYAATGGASGPRPGSLFSRFAGGFVFGRSGWGTSRPFAEETFYSVRTGAGAPAVLHGHADQTAVTFSSHGSPLLGDSGVYRYTRNAARTYVTSRRGHTSVTLAGLASRAAAVRTRTRTGARYDLVSMDDVSYAAAKAVVRRDVFFSRTGRWLLVLDTVAAPRSVRVDQRWQLDPSLRTALARRAATGTGPRAGVALRWLGTAPSLSVARGRKGRSARSWSGWTSTSYGDLTPAPTVQASVRGRRVTLATLVLPVAKNSAAPGRPGGIQVTGSVSGGTVTAAVRVPGRPVETVRLRHGRVVAHTVDR